MNSLSLSFLFLGCISLGATQTVLAEPNTHRGEVDTDGILSRGEIPNRHIDYGRYPQSRPNGSHAGEMDTDGILSPGEIPNPRIDYSRRRGYYPRPSMVECGWRNHRIDRPHIEIYGVKKRGNFFGDKIKVRGRVEGKCLTEAGLYEEGRLVQLIPISTTDSYHRFEFEVNTRRDRYPELRAYNSEGEAEVIAID